jgi:hypothetical protein
MLFLALAATGQSIRLVSVPFSTLRMKLVAVVACGLRREMANPEKGSTSALTPFYEIVWMSQRHL